MCCTVTPTSLATTTAVGSTVGASLIAITVGAEETRVSGSTVTAAVDGTVTATFNTGCSLWFLRVARLGMASTRGLLHRNVMVAAWLESEVRCGPYQKRLLNRQILVLAKYVVMYMMFSCFVYLIICVTSEKNLL